MSAVLPDAAIDAVRKYRWQFSGMVAHVVQRVTGLLLLSYLFVHVRTIRELSNGPAAFNRAVGEFGSPFFKLLEIALLGTVILHAFNGVRLTLLDLSIGHKRQRQLFWIWSVGLGTALFLAAAVPLFVHSVLKV
jgi:succinate dehydrogenase / fumarate reductase, cytochrome b subunit